MWVLFSIAQKDTSLQNLEFGGSRLPECSRIDEVLKQELFTYLKSSSVS